MKKSITYKEITLLIGVLVALLVALTLWTTLPAASIPGTNSHRTTGIHSLLKDLHETAVTRYFLLAIGP